MSLAPGTRLGPYEIVAPLGAGGMGEVFKARDTRLDRTVAIKILPQHVAANPELRSRFEREARVVSSLEHPNICILHDVGRAPAGGGDGAVEFLVMQYLEGETLAARLGRGPLPIEEALRYAIEIASALDKAHTAGVLHRDLKPGNVMLTKSGGSRQGFAQAKLLDFGLAKLAPEAAAQPVQQTATSPLTGQGTILGTLQYMAPEQLEGRHVDARSDIFAFGAMLYEMVTGARPFDGASQASIIAAILDRDPPPLATRAPLTPPALERVVRKCLDKDPDRRWQSARDLCDELAWIASQGSGADLLAQLPVTRRSQRARRWGTAGAAIAAALAAGTLIGWASFRQDRRTPVVRHLAITPPDNVQMAAGGLALSPDGTLLAYVAEPVADRPGATPLGRIYLRRLDSDTTTAIAGTEGGFAPFFSPDSRWVGYFTKTTLYKVSVLGGAPVKILDVPPVSRGGVWGPGETIIISPTQSSSLLRLDASAGAPPGGIMRLVGGPAGSTDAAQLWPSLLPDGSAVIFTRRNTRLTLDDADIVIQDLKSGEQRVLVTGGAYARVSDAGHLLFVRGRTLVAAPFDAGARKITGDALPIVDDVALHPWYGGAHYAISREGTLVYLRGSFVEPRFEVVWVDRSGKAGSVVAAGAIRAPRLSPDGTRVLVVGSSPAGDADILAATIGRGGLVRLTTEQADDFSGLWSHDGARILYSTFKVGTLPTLVMSAPGRGEAEAVAPRSEPQFATSVSRDGVVAYTSYADGTRADIYAVPLAAPRTPQKITATAADEYGAEFSPDGRWIAYVSDESGAREIYVVPYQGAGHRQMVSRGGGFAPVWCRACSELYYQTADGVMAVSVTPGPQPAFGEPRLLFGGYSTASEEDNHRDFDAAADGTRFLMVRAQPQANAGRPPSLQVVIDWPGRLGGAAAR